MNFTYESYRTLISNIRDNGFQITDYHNWQEYDKCVILRHDIDYDIKKALEFARFEHELDVSGTYFALLTSDFYNVYSRNSCNCLTEIYSLGHEIGLHFDEVRYDGLSADEICEKIIEECQLLSKAIGMPVTAVSMHRPSKAILDADLDIPGIVNSYGSTFFHEFKYVSDSRMRWREPVEEYVENGTYDRLHILTHPFWYFTSEMRGGLRGIIKSFVNSGNMERYNNLKDNFTGLEDVMEMGEVR